MYHGHGNLDKAIDLLDNQNKENFRKFVESENAFNPYNMLLCKSQKILKEYYDSLFNWLSRCEAIFGFNMSDSYGSVRIYGFLAERYLSYWFQKNSKSINLNIVLLSNDFLRGNIFKILKLSKFHTLFYIFLNIICTIPLNISCAFKLG